MAPNKVTALKVDRPRDIQERPPLTSRNMEVCLGSRDLSQLDLWVASSLQPNMEGRPVVMVAHRNNHQLHMEASRWVMEPLLPPALVVMVVDSRPLMLNGVNQLRKLSGTAFKDTRDRMCLVVS